jgi:hypothetical protein
MNDSHASCRCIALASGPLGQVLACPECGTIHLSLPQVSLRLSLDNFNELSAMVGKAQGRLDEARARMALECAGNRSVH